MLTCAGVTELMLVGPLAEFLRGLFLVLAEFTQQAGIDFVQVDQLEVVAPADPLDVVHDQSG